MIKNNCIPIQSTSRLYLDIIESGILEFTRLDLLQAFGNKYAQATYCTFPPKHCCDGNCNDWKNKRGYVIYFCRISRGRYRVICNRICPTDKE